MENNHKLLNMIILLQISIAILLLVIIFITTYSYNSQNKYNKIEISNITPKIEYCDSISLYNNDINNAVEMFKILKRDYQQYLDIDTFVIRCIYTTIGSEVTSKQVVQEYNKNRKFYNNYKNYQNGRN